MPQMNGGQALMHSLERMGADIVFGVPGAGQYEAVDALYQHPAIRYVSTRNEQETTFMADAYAQIAGKPAVALVVPGPGLLYAGAGLVSAFANSSPVLLVTSTNSDPVLRQNQLELRNLQTMTKWAVQVESLAEIPDAVQEAYRQMLSGRPRPVGLVVPSRVLAEVDDVALPAGPLTRERPVAPGVEQAVAWLQQAQRPLLWVGSGVFRSGAEALVREFAGVHGIPVVSSRRGKGIVGDSHPLGLGSAEMRYPPLRDWIHARDLILAIGVGQDFSRFPVRVIQIDIDPALPARSQDDVLMLQGDARATLEAIRDGLADRPLSPPAAESQELAALKAQRWDPTHQLQPQWGFMQAIREVAPPDTIFLQGMNQMGYYSRNYLYLDPPGRLLTSSSQITLGAAYLLSLGAKLAAPERPVVAISGDGGFGYCSGAMATAVQHGIHAVVLVFNDNAYGNVLRAQKEQFDMRVIGTRLHNPEFPALAHTYGALGYQAHNDEELGQVLAQALQQDQHALIEIPVGELDRIF